MKFIHVVAAVIEKNNAILIAKRPDNKHQGGLWEFPGGKVENGESPQQALARELKEEVDIEVKQCRSFLKLKHQYSDKSVFLDIYKVDDFIGEARGLEGQDIKWVERDQLQTYQFPAANDKILSALNAHELLCITPENIKESPSLDQWLSLKKKILSHGITAILLRAPLLQDKCYVNLYKKFSEFLLSEGMAENVRLIVNRQNLIDVCDVRSLHLSAIELARLSRRPDNIFLSSSCHNEAEIAFAEQIGCDQVFLSPIQATSSHPDSRILGWEKAQTLVELSRTPILLLGGMRIDDLTRAKDIGAFGVAGITNFF